MTNEMQKMKSQFANVESIFAYNEVSMTNTQALGECFANFYTDGSEMANYYGGIKRDMCAN